jgi:serine/threonine protein kinase
MGGKMRDKWRWDVTFPGEFSECAKSFIRAILKEDPEQRASIRECRSHEFISKYCRRSERWILEEGEGKILE